MVKSINKVGVIGAGLMGSSLAAQFANVGMEAVLLDIVPPDGLSDEDRKKGLTEESPEFRNRFAANGLKATLKAKPAAFYVPEAKELISIGNLEDDFDQLADCDWIVEVVVENLKIKRELFSKIEKIFEAQGLENNKIGVTILKGYAVEKEEQLIGGAEVMLQDGEYTFSVAVEDEFKILGIGKALGFHEGIVAGAIISGAYFGDKMSPLSDTTNLAPAMAGTDLFTHIRYMMITTVPSLTMTSSLGPRIGRFTSMLRSTR